MLSFPLGSSCDRAVPCNLSRPVYRIRHGGFLFEMRQCALLTSLWPLHFSLPLVRLPLALKALPEQGRLVWAADMPIDPRRPSCETANGYRSIRWHACQASVLTLRGTDLQRTSHRHWCLSCGCRSYQEHVLIVFGRHKRQSENIARRCFLCQPEVCADRKTPTTSVAFAL